MSTNRQFEVIGRHGSKVTVEVLVSELPEFKELSHNWRKKAQQEWVQQRLRDQQDNILENKENTTGSFLVPLGPYMARKVTCSSQKRPHSSNDSTPTTPASQSVESSPITKPKKPCMNSPKSLLLPATPIASLVTIHDTGTSDSVVLMPSSASTTIPPPPKLPEVNSSEVVPSTALSIIESLRQLETGFGEKIADMNKILHDVKGLSTSVATVKTDIDANVKPKVATLMCQVATLKEDIHKPQVGIDARVDELEKWRSSLPVAVADSTAVSTSSPASLTSNQIQTKFDDMQSEIDCLKRKVNDQAVNLSIVAGWSDLLVKSNKSLQDQVSHNLSRHLQHELVLGGVRQVNNELCKAAALEFFQKKVKVEVDMKDIWTAYPKGSATTKTIEGVRVKCPPTCSSGCASCVRQGYEECEES